MSSPKPQYTVTATHATPLDDTALDELREGFRGTLCLPNDEEYEETRVIYNAMIDKRPGLIARCTDAADVIAAVQFAREHDIDVAIRSGGHSGPGLSLVDDGMVVDLSEMTGVHVDPDARTVHVRGVRGATSTTPPTPSGWRRLAVSSRRLASAV